MVTLASIINAFIDWAPSQMLELGPVHLRYYSLCWVIGLALAYVVVQRLYKEQKLSNEDFEPLFMYCFLGILIGARLGHCLFYEPDYYVHHAIEMFFPIKEVYNPEMVSSWLNWVPCTHGGLGWTFVGYEGLASHGGTLGLMIALALYVRKTHINIMRVLDNIAIATPITACFIRLGNLMNSEIIGNVSDVPWAFIFHTRSAMIDGQLVARHPAQLYEALAYLLLFFIGWIIYKKYSSKVGTGFYFGLCLTYIFTFRFFIEFLKEVQGGVDDGSTIINVGQMLSIPFVILGVACMIGGSWLKNIAEKKAK
ncbi:MAG: prolipoprotein diacylglyceryl transferase [Bacteroidaceae bacterium]|nr:prolipoprotein diacylglyceryl transferase [Bacteroidaceae bacterium]